MRAAPPVLCCGVMTLSRTNLPLAAIAWLVTLAVLPRTCTTVVKLVPSAETWMSKSRVFQVVLSPPAPACRTVNDTIDPRRAEGVVEPPRRLRRLLRFQWRGDDLVGSRRPTLVGRGRRRRWWP